MMGWLRLPSRYDAFILDVWGVLHDGVTLYPGVVDTLERLDRCGQTIRHADQRTEAQQRRAEAMIGMGMPEKYCQKILSSGEATFPISGSVSTRFYASVGNRFLLHWPRTRPKPVRWAGLG